jgi:hypothetical protein
MTLPRILALAGGLSLIATQGCSASQVLGPSDAAAGAAGAGASPKACLAPGYHVDASAIQVGEVQALIHDPSGATVPQLPIQVCGTDQCTYGSTDAAGKVDVVLEAKLILPAFKYGDGFDFAELAIQLAAGKQDLGELVALPLPGYADGAAFPKSGEIRNGDVTLSIDSKTRVVHDTLSYDASELVFRSVPIPVSDSRKALDPSFGFELAYALAPLGTTFCPPAHLSLKNTLHWVAGAAVEVFVQGLNADEEWAPYGTWVKVADGRVSADAATIDTTSGGITVLSSIAVRLK